MWRAFWRPLLVQYWLWCINDKDIVYHSVVSEVEGGLQQAANTGSHCDYQVDHKCFVVREVFFLLCPDKSGQEFMSGINLAFWKWEVKAVYGRWLIAFCWPVYQSGQRRIRLKTVLTRRRQPISISVFLYLLLCSSTDTSPWSQSRNIVGMFVQVITWMAFWNKLLPFLNCSEVISLATTMAREWRR